MFRWWFFNFLQVVSFNFKNTKREWMKTQDEQVYFETIKIFHVKMIHSNNVILFCNESWDIYISSKKSSS